MKEQAPRVYLASGSSNIAARFTIPGLPMRADKNIDT